MKNILLILIIIYSNISHAEEDTCHTINVQAGLAWQKDGQPFSGNITCTQNNTTTSTQYINGKLNGVQTITNKSTNAFNKITNHYKDSELIQHCNYDSLDRLRSCVLYSSGKRIEFCKYTNYKNGKYDKKCNKI